MKRKILTLLFSVMVALVCAYTFVACGDKADGNATVNNINGVYYHYDDGVLNKRDYVTINGEKWTSSGGDYGTIKTSGASISFYTQFFGESIEYTSGTVNDGVLKIRGNGKWEYYCKEGKTPPIEGNEPPIDTSTITVAYNANGGAFTDDKTTFEQTVDANSILTAPQSPSRKNYYFSGWATSADGNKLWNFATDIVSGNITLYAVWQQQSAVIFSVDGASIDDNAMSVFLLVEHGIDNVSLSNKVVCSNDSTWKLYYDRLGQTEIPTKIAASRTGELTNGDNVFYIVVTSANGTQVNTYTLTVHRSYMVNVSFYDNKQHLINQDEVYTGYEYNVDYTPSIDGYVFNYWKNAYGNETTKITPYGKVDLYADCTARKYSAYLNTNGGNEVSKTEYEVTYDQGFSFNVPMRNGYMFLGWYDGSTQITNSSGRSVENWTFTNNKTLKAQWQANQYRVTLNTSDSKAGTVTGAGDYDYDSNVTVTATTNNGYTWLGWYDSDNQLVTMDLSYSFKMGFATRYTAKWTYYTLTTTKNDNNAGYINTKNAVKTTAGQSVTITAETNNGYTWLGWYDGRTELTKDLNYTFKMPSTNITYTAKWIICPVTLEKSISMAGGVSMPNKTVVDENVTVTATTNSGYTWVGWYNGETELTKDLSYTFRISTENVTYTAKWIKVIVDRNDTSAGSISTLNGKYKAGDSVTITATTNNGYTWLGWYNGETEITKNLNYTFDMPADNVTYMAKWITCPVMLERNTTAGGNVSMPNATVVGENITITVITNRGYEFKGWYNGEELLTENNNYTFSMSLESITYTAKWEVKNEMENFIFISSPTSLTINGVKDKEISEIILPTDVTSIADYSFSGCSNITSIEIPSSVTNIGNKAFSNCSSLETVYWNAIECEFYCGSFDQSLFPGCTKLTTVIIGSLVTKIPSYAFYECNSLTSIEIPSGIKSIGLCAFAYCSNLQTVYWNAVSCTYAGEEGWTSFFGCNNLTSVIFGDAVTTIPPYAFDKYGDTLKDKLTSITFPKNSRLKSIGKYAFYRCDYLTGVEIPNSVTSIGKCAFYRCRSLTSLTIGNSVTNIGDDAFCGCDSLASIYYTGTTDDWTKISIGLGNTCLTEATRYYYSETQPTETGNYWHYDDNGEIVIW
ncbi:MAG: leucine-rich repeat protein [Clostridiales bacterium]|nr:leucine-rich repeat protein [Clostridiales bacterium]